MVSSYPLQVIFIRRHVATGAGMFGLGIRNFGLLLFLPFLALKELVFYPSDELRNFIMKIITKRSFLKLNENGFTLTELVIASAISLALLAIIGGVIKLQGNTFKQQIGSGQMQANGRAAVDFISRSIFW